MSQKHSMQKNATNNTFIPRCVIPFDWMSVSVFPWIQFTPSCIFTTTCSALRPKGASEQLHGVNREQKRRVARCLHSTQELEFVIFVLKMNEVVDF
jgi:hypothetical protein